MNHVSGSLSFLHNCITKQLVERWNRLKDFLFPSRVVESSFHTPPYFTNKLQVHTAVYITALAALICYGNTETDMGRHVFFFMADSRHEASCTTGSRAAAFEGPALGPSIQRASGSQRRARPKADQRHGNPRRRRRHDKTKRQTHKKKKDTLQKKKSNLIRLAMSLVVQHQNKHVMVCFVQLHVIVARWARRKATSSGYSGDTDLHCR